MPVVLLAEAELLELLPAVPLPCPVDEEELLLEEELELLEVDEEELLEELLLDDELLELELLELEEDELLDELELLELDEDELLDELELLELDDVLPFPLALPVAFPPNAISGVTATCAIEPSSDRCIVAGSRSSVSVCSWKPPPFQHTVSVTPAVVLVPSTQ